MWLPTMETAWESEKDIKPALNKKYFKKLRGFYTFLS
jgi:hypothetical protein